MRRLLTGHAINFNRRHKRYGHLFQNRYKSVVCEEDTYFRELVRYIHLNPIQTGFVSDLAELDQYPWCGTLPSPAIFLRRAGFGLRPGVVRINQAAVRATAALEGPTGTPPRSGWGG
jgi:hypothetical protein